MTEFATAAATGAMLPESLTADLMDLLVEHVVANDRSRTHVTEVPFSGMSMPAVPQSTVEDVEIAMQLARTAQRAWAKTTLRERSKLALKLHRVMTAETDLSLDILQADTGKSRIHAFEEFGDILIHCRWYGRNLKKLMGEKSRKGLLMNFTQVREVRHPKGVIGVIAPWNYPFTLTMSDILPALLAGNAVVIKPDSQTVLTALWSAELFRRAGFPSDLVQVVVGAGRTIGGAVIDSCDHIAFTGSTATGQAVAAQASARLIGMSMELGGKNAAYVTDDVNIERAAEAMVRDCFANSGQLCVSIERIIVHEKVADEFTEAFVRRVEALKQGTGYDFSYDIGSLIGASHLKTVQEHVDQAIDAGATLLTGGKARPEIGPYYFAPTVFADVPETAICHAEETFGPVVAIHRVSNDDEAVALANGTEYGLNGTIWCRNTKRADLLARLWETGTVSINEAFTVTWGSVAAPMGGRKQSGMGRRHGAEGLTRYTEAQTVARQRLPLGFIYGRGGKFVATNLNRLFTVLERLRFPHP